MNKKDITTLLLDLDGTLLKVDMENFIPVYVDRLASFFAHLAPPEKFRKKLLSATRTVISSKDPGESNEEIFFRVFLQSLDLSPKKVMPLLDEFYSTEYPRLKSMASPHPHAPSLLETAQKKGLEVVIATNPIFPAAAIKERMRWAGIDEFPFLLVTTLENMHFCKPHPEFYTEILQKINRSPSSCLMAGNDVLEDLVACKTGMFTYLVDETLVNTEELENCHYDWRGSLEELQELISLL